jgi:hypothetical protein
LNRLVFGSHSSSKRKTYVECDFKANQGEQDISVDTNDAVVSCVDVGNTVDEGQNNQNAVGKNNSKDVEKIELVLESRLPGRSDNKHLFNEKVVQKDLCAHIAEEA